MKTRITRQGTIHYLECVDCGEPKTTRFQRVNERCKPCVHKKRFEHLQDKVEGLRECKVCGETKPSTNEFFHYKHKKTGRLDRTCKVCDNNRKNNWNKTNPEKKRKHGRDTFSKNYDKWKSNKAWVMKRRVSTTVANMMKERGVSKDHQTWKTLPYSPEQLKEHLENQFDDKMTWDNYGTYWHIDHIYPQSRLPYDSLEHPNFQKCWSLDNLQPLEAKANIRKGDKIDD